MMSLKDMVFGDGMFVSLEEVRDGHLVYNLVGPPGIVLTFQVPPEDQLGAVFPLSDTPKTFMRWIRKERERLVEDEKYREEARRKWAEEIGEKERWDPPSGAQG